MSKTTGWGFFIQGSDQQAEVMELGEKLSKAIHCPVHYPAYNKNMFECRCGVIFPVYLVKTEDWDKINKKHQEERLLLVDA